MDISMEQLEERVRHLFGVSIETQMGLADKLSSSIASAGNRLVNCLLTDSKILLCGHGGSAANCLHFSNALINRFEVDRPPLPVIALSTDISIISDLAHEGHQGLLFARQIQALGQQGDILMTLSTSGNTNSILQAIDAAHDRGIDVIALTGDDGGQLVNHLGPEDLELRVAGVPAALTREMHLFILYCLCDLIDLSLFGTGITST
jgi:D-sedoheptulose 7-phosphate isomerase